MCLPFIFLFFSVVYTKTSQKMDTQQIYTLEANPISNLCITDEFLIILLYNNQNYILKYIQRKGDTQKHQSFPLNIKKSNQFFITSNGFFTIILSEDGEIFFHQDTELIQTNIQLSTWIKNPAIMGETNEEYVFHLLKNRDILEEIKYNKTTKEITRKMTGQLPTYFPINYKIPSHMITLLQGDDRFLFVPGANGLVETYKNEKFLWSSDFNSPYVVLLNLILHKGTYYLLAHNNRGAHIHCYNLEGEKLWEKSSIISYLPFYYRKPHNIYLVNNNDNTLIVLDITSGEILQTINLNHKIYTQKTSINHIYYYFLQNEKIVFFTDSGIYSFDKNYKFKRALISINNQQSLPVQDPINKDIYFIYKKKIYSISA